MAAAALVAAIVLAAFGSSSIDGLRSIGSPGRWAALVVLGVLALAAAALPVDGRRRLPDLRPYALTAFLLAVMLVSAAWSVDGALTVKRTVSLALALGTAAALGVAAASRPTLLGKLLLAIPLAATLVCVAGLVLVAVDSSAANQAGAGGSLGRFRGIGENPNTVPILCAVALPLAARACMLGSRSRRSLALAAALLLYGVIVYSGSRGGLIGGLVGTVVAVALWPAPWRHRVTVAVAVAAAYVGLFAIAYEAAGGIGNTTLRVPAPHARPVPATLRVPARSSAPARPVRRLTVLAARPPSQTIPPLAQSPSYRGPLEEELARRGAPGRKLLGTSGRSAAWSGAIRQGDQRPLLGYGFGTEEQVFFDRYYNFQGGHAESSYIGMYLQLGLVGVVVLIALIAVLGLAAVRAARGAACESAAMAAAAAGAVAGGFTQALVQSFVYSAGNIGTLALWTAVFGLAAVAGRAAVRTVRPAVRAGGAA